MNLIKKLFILATLSTCLVSSELYAEISAINNNFLSNLKSTRSIEITGNAVQQSHRSIKPLFLEGRIIHAGRFTAVLTREREKTWESANKDRYQLYKGNIKFKTSKYGENKIMPISATIQKTSNGESLLRLFTPSGGKSAYSKIRLFELRVPLNSKISGKNQRVVVDRSFGSELACKTKENSLSNFAVETSATTSAKASSLPASQFREIELDMQVDYEIYQKYGDNSESNAASVINGAEAIYERDLGLTFDVKRIGIQKSPEQPFKSKNFERLLEQFVGAPQRSESDSYHLLTGKQIEVLGVAYFAVTCQKDSPSYGLSMDVNAGENILTFAHEEAHKLGADHDYNLPPNMMSPSAAPDLLAEFSEISKKEISDYLSEHGSCLSREEAGSETPTPDATETPSSTEIVADEIEVFKDFYRQRQYLIFLTTYLGEFAQNQTLEILCSRSTTEEPILLTEVIAEADAFAILPVGKAGVYFARVKGTNVVSRKILVK